MSKKKIILKASKNAPEFIAQGHLDAQLKNGYFETAHRAFADSIIAKGYGTEVERKEAAPKKSAAKSSAKAKKATVAKAAQEAAAKSAAESIESAESKPEGETK